MDQMVGSGCPCLEKDSWVMEGQMVVWIPDGELVAADPARRTNVGGARNSLAECSLALIERALCSKARGVNPVRKR